MPLGINVPDLGIDFGSFMGIVGDILGALLLFIVAGIFLFFILRFTKTKKYFDKKIFWFEEVHSDMVPIDEDTARELTIPNTNIKIFYIKKKDMYLPRLTIKMGKNSYWVCVKKNRELVNFKMKNLNKEMKEANLEYDHTDMRYANVNIHELIKRNYRDKAIPWWREYKDIIAVVILIFVVTLGTTVIIMQMKALIGQVGALIEHADKVVQSAGALKESGIQLK